MQGEIKEKTTFMYTEWSSVQRYGMMKNMCLYVFSILCASGEIKQHSPDLSV